MNQHEPIAAILARAAAPSEASRALREVIEAMASDAAGAGLDARVELDRLDDTLRLMQSHVFETIEAYSARVAQVQSMYQRQKHLAVLGQQALYQAGIAPPAVPAELLEAGTPAAEE